MFWKQQPLQQTIKKSLTASTSTGAKRRLLVENARFVKIITTDYTVAMIR